MSTTPPASPPRNSHELRPSLNASRNTTSSDESDIIDELSFDYRLDENGNVIRTSRGGRTSQHSSPPTPQEVSLLADSPQPESKESSPNPSASLLSRAAVARSENAYAAHAEPNFPSVNDSKSSRPLQRVTSLPPSVTSRSRQMPRRVPQEELRDRPDGNPVAARSRQASESVNPNPYAQEEKENIMDVDEKNPAPPIATRRPSPPLPTRPLASARMSSSRTSSSSSIAANGRTLGDGPMPQRIPRQGSGVNRAVRSMYAAAPLKYTAPGADKFQELVESNDPYAAKETDFDIPPQTAGSDYDSAQNSPVEPGSIPLPNSANANGLRHRLHASGNVYSTSLGTSGSNRPRRSASLSEAHQHDDYQLQVAGQPQPSISRPGTSLGIDHEKEDVDHHQLRQAASPSPVHVPQRASSAYGHRRRDSDTLRAPGTSAGIGSPTVAENGSRPSPSSTGRVAPGRASPSTSLRGRRSPPAVKGRMSPSGLSKGRTSPPVPVASRSVAGRDPAKLVRSPTAPERRPGSSLVSSYSTRSEQDAVSAEKVREQEREREREMEIERERERMARKEREYQQGVPVKEIPPYDKRSSIQGAPQAVAPPTNQLNRHIVVNKKAYARLDMIGKGGSSRVYRVLNHANELYAIKRVSLDKTDAETMSGYMNEIALLKRLEGNSRIIRLIDSEVKPGPGGTKGHLLLVMECGEVDLARLLQEQMREPVNMVWVAYYWQQMLQAVHVIHEEKIVHSDLKPANFVLVRGQLKLIDFGIANAIANDTTNIQRDHQIGTVNYMSPEAIELPDGMRRLKVGRPSDVWSLGCILYQMVYGHPPFQHLSVYQKMKAIPDESHVIEFPEYAVPSIPSKLAANGVPEPPKRLEHLKRRVGKAVIAGMKSCLCRSPKERATIPELLEQEWMSGNSSMKNSRSEQTPALEDLLGPQEVVINPHYMAQLLAYGMNLGRSHPTGWDQDDLDREAARLVQELRGIHHSSSAQSSS